MYWQNTRAAVLYDLSYVIENAYRIARGDVPYRDFPLVHVPGTFLTQALIIRIFDASWRAQIAYVVLSTALTSAATYRIVVLLLRGRVRHEAAAALLICLPLVGVSNYVNLSTPFYDPDTCMWVIFAIWGTVEARSRGYPAALSAAAGALCPVPLFFKQNIGLPFLAVTGVVSLVHLFEADPKARRGWRWLVLGATAMLGVCLLALQCTAGLNNFYRWTVTVAAQRRLPPLSSLLDVYQQPWPWIWAAISAAGIAIARFGRPAAVRWLGAVTTGLPWLWLAAYQFGFAPFGYRGNIFTLWALAMTLGLLSVVAGALRRDWRWETFLPLVLVATAHGAFLSQGVGGSSYGIGPLLCVLGATFVASAHPLAGPEREATSIALCVAWMVGVLVSGGDCARGLWRLRYADILSGPPVRSSHAMLAGMMTPGPYLPALDEVLSYLEANSRPEQPIMTIPGEDPLFFALRRRPSYPVLLLEGSTLNPYSSDELVRFVREKDIEWIVEKTKFQIYAGPYPAADVVARMTQGFVVALQTPSYRVFRRQPAAR